MGKTWELTNAAWRKSSYSSDTGGECVECAPLSGAAWRKSSYSGNTGGECIECAPVNGAAWRKSSYSGDTGGQCLELAPTPEGHVALRDSKNPEGAVFAVTRTAFRAFTNAAAQGTLPS